MSERNGEVHCGFGCGDVVLRFLVFWGGGGRMLKGGKGERGKGEGDGLGGLGWLVEVVGLVVEGWGGC